MKSITLLFLILLLCGTVKRNLKIERYFAGFGRLSWLRVKVGTGRGSKHATVCIFPGWQWIPRLISGSSSLESPPQWRVSRDRISPNLPCWQLLTDKTASAGNLVGEGYFSSSGRSPAQNPLDRFSSSI
jgi:hypothetical protein